MSQNGNNDNNGNDNSSAKSKIPFGTKVGYIGTGILIGLVIYPFVRKAVSKIQPQMDKVFDDLTGRAENLAEKTSDLLARAKDNLRRSEMEDDHDHDHSHADSKA